MKNHLLAALVVLSLTSQAAAEKPRPDLLQCSECQKATNAKLDGILDAALQTGVATRAIVSKIDAATASLSATIVAGAGISGRRTPLWIERQQLDSYGLTTDGGASVTQYDFRVLSAATEEVAAIGAQKVCNAIGYSRAFVTKKTGGPGIAGQATAERFLCFD